MCLCVMCIQHINNKLYVPVCFCHFIQYSLKFVFRVKQANSNWRNTFLLSYVYDLSFMFRLLFFRFSASIFGSIWKKMRIHTCRIYVCTFRFISVTHFCGIVGDDIFRIRFSIDFGILVGFSECDKGLLECEIKHLVLRMNVY